MMSNEQNNQLVPYLSIAGAGDAVEFYSRVFDVKPYVRLDMPDGRLMHCEFRFAGARFFISEELPEHGGTPSPKSLKNTTVALHLYVDDCDQLADTMQQSGAEVLMQPSDMFWGERFARVRDPFGHKWGIATVIREMGPTEIEQAANAMLEQMALAENDPSQESK